MNSLKDTGDPNRCRLELHVADELEARDVRSKMQPLLVGLDPTFFYINVLTPTNLKEEHSNLAMEDIQRLVKMNQSLHNHQIGTGSPCAPPGGACEKLKTPALAVMVFLKDSSVISYEQAQNILKSPPWKFHHKIELSNARRGQLKVIGRQEFYQCHRQVPLWSVCPIHYGNLHLRFTIFTRNFSSMVDFYRLLVGHEAEFTRENFCLFSVYSRPGFDLQLAIKQSSQLHPAPLSSTFLNFSVPNFRQLEAMIQTPNGLAGTLGRLSDNVWLVQDPDLNCVLVEETRNPDHLRSNSNILTTDAHNGNRRNVPNSDPFRRSRMLRDQFKLVKKYESDCQSDPHTKQSYRCYGSELGATSNINRTSQSRAADLQGGHYDIDNHNAPWSDQSSYDSGRHSWRSGQETGATSSSDQSGQSDDAETSVTCDCHVITAGRCARCISQKSRSVLAPLPRSSSPNIEHREEKTARWKNRKTKPWEIEPPELSEVEWDGLLSLADSDDVNFR